MARTAARPIKRKRRDDDDTVIPDGGGVKVSLALMDSWQRAVHDHFYKPKPVAVINTGLRHAPGYIDSNSQTVRDAKRKAVQSRDAWLARQSSAWRSTAAPLLPATVGVSDRAKAIAAREAKIRMMCDAWRTPTPVRDNAAYLQPQTPQRQALWGAMQQMGAKVDVPSSLPDPAAVQARRDAQFAQRCRDLENAWRSPSARANEVERQRRTLTHEDRR
jgi:hypothetical protein